MNEDTRHEKLQSYRIQVGHNIVIVQGTTPAEAVGEARRQLSLELPRLWDVIQSLSDDRFQILATT